MYLKNINLIKINNINVETRWAFIKKTKKNRITNIRIIINTNPGYFPHLWIWHFFIFLIISNFISI